MTRKLLPYDRRPYRDCVGCALFDRRGLVFAGKRVDDDGGHWQMPQGGIDKGETPRAAALRELHEEVGTDRAEVIGEIDRWLGYDLPPDIADRVWGGRYRGQRQRWFALRFTGNDRDIVLHGSGPNHHPEFAEWRWMKLGALAAAAIAFKRDIYVQVAADFARFAKPAR
ncbi:MAG: RNA pyrophosphohydrolase [Alphaproteobacteria bacterium]|nr:RNA pyrophosphohydrolase [Alphaproteobacteria bacterium]